MTKFSNFIRAPGTAGPPTRQGIEDLGFVTDQDIPGILGKYVRVDAAQAFSNGEKTQGQTNIGTVIGTDVQAFSPSLASLAGITTAADRLAYTTAPNTWSVTTLTAFARTILDDTNASGVRTTIGLGNVDNTSDVNKPISTATQDALNLKAPLASPTFAGIPAVPTAPPGTNTTQAASTAFALNAAVKKGFSANKNGVDQTGIAATPTKLTFTTESFDIGNQYDAANSRFQPSVAGTYRVAAAVWISGALTSGANYQLHIYKNGAPVATFAARSPSTAGYSICVSKLIQFNGTTDYVEVFYEPATASQTILGGSAFSYFEASEL